MLKKVSLQTESASKASMLRRAINSEKIIPLLIFIPLCLLIGTINPTFFTWKTWQNIMMQVSNVGIIAFGAMFVITSGGLDFTAGEGVSLAGVFAATVFVASKMDNTATILAGLAMGAIMGAVNGLLIIKMKIQPFIATLSVMTIIKGFLLFLSEGVIIHFDVEGATFTRIGQGIIPFPSCMGLSDSGEIQGIPIAFVIYMCIAVIVYFLLHKTRFGQATLAMGGNEEAARLAGVRVDFYRFWVYVFAGLMTGAGAIITLARVASIGISLGGTTLLMDVVAAAVIGGTSVSGGRCNVFGVVIGTFLVVCITSALIYLQIDPNWRDVVKGIIILVALLIDGIAAKVRQYASLRLLRSQ
jgi:ribose/xylose/arabinose/galactoside ABC-type transport system permease subunit